MKTYIPVEIPNELHPDTQSLVIRFAAALAEKLHSAEQKYGYSDGWMTTGWIERGECRDRLIEHIEKGDPRDVAAYCAFLWHHGASTKEKLYPTCEAVGHCPRPTEDAAPFHHFYWDSSRDDERMSEIHDRGAGHDDPMSAYGAVMCKTCGKKALVLSDAEDFPEI